MRPLNNNDFYRLQKLEFVLFALIMSISVECNVIGTWNCSRQQSINYGIGDLASYIFANTKCSTLICKMRIISKGNWIDWMVRFFHFIYGYCIVCYKYAGSLSKKTLPNDELHLLNSIQFVISKCFEFNFFSPHFAPCET